MTDLLPLYLATGLYAWQAAIFVWRGEYPLTLVFICYAIANYGLILAGKRALT